MTKKFNIHNSTLLETDDDNCELTIYISPEQDQIEKISKKYDIDKHTIDSALDPDEVSRLELDGENIFIIWKRPKNYVSTDNFLFGVSSIGLFYFNDKLIVVLPEDIPLFDQNLNTR
jgi:magnesium transporter